MAMRVAMRGVAARPVLTPQLSARPVLSWAARWKGSAAPAKGDGADKKGDAVAKAEPVDADKTKASAAAAPELPVTFEVGTGLASEGEKMLYVCVDLECVLLLSSTNTRYAPKSVPFIPVSTQQAGW